MFSKVFLKNLLTDIKDLFKENYNEIKNSFMTFDTSDFDSLIDTKEIAKSLDLEEEDFINENNCIKIWRYFSWYN